MEKNVLKDVNLNIDSGKITGIIGPSGVGKSTILNIISGLSKPSSGEVIVNEIDIVQLDKQSLRRFQKDIGVVFQDYNLLSNLSVFKNVSLPLKLKGLNKEQIIKETNRVLEYVNLLDESSSYPSQLSGGMRQRVAISRAIIHQPKLLLLDEITSSLDQETSKVIIDLLKRINKELNITILIVSHDLSTIKKLCDTVYVLDEGMIKDRLELNLFDDNLPFDYKRELGIAS
ncbi:MAG: ATP-binding cassette domain-containing protein [Acholeplasmataceae bacterium]|nr:ATP-binding cassette domain-containing protein [Acholeplasmataceae bacterium]